MLTSCDDCTKSCSATALACATSIVIAGSAPHSRSQQLRSDARPSCANHGIGSEPTRSIGAPCIHSSCASLCRALTAMEEKRSALSHDGLRLCGMMKLPPHHSSPNDIVRSSLLAHHQKSMQSRLAAAAVSDAALSAST